jgi:hypothetical protein
MKSSLTLFSEFFKAAEVAVSEDPSSYKGLDLRALCTDPEDVRSIIRDPLIHGTWVDLGSGLGHTVFTYKESFPDRDAIGIERELSRVEASRKISSSLRVPATFIHGDLLTSPLPEGQTYFLYFPQGHVLDRILSELARRETFTLVAIESHGDLFQRLEKESWLKLEKEIPLKSARHHPFARIYRARGNNRSLSGLHQHSFRENFFLIEDGSKAWWGDSFGLYAVGEDYLLEHPPRTVKAKDIVKTLTKTELAPVLSFLISLRRLPGIEVMAKGKSYHGPIRKILGRDTFSVEFPGGEQLQWDEIELIKQGNRICYDSSSDLFFLPPVL